MSCKCVICFLLSSWYLLFLLSSLGFILFMDFFCKALPMRFWHPVQTPICLCNPIVDNSSFIVVVHALWWITMVTACLLITFISKGFLPVLLPLRWKLISRNKIQAPHKYLKLRYNSSWVNELVMSAESSEEEISVLF